MTQLLHDLGGGAFGQRLQLARLEYLDRSEAAAGAGRELRRPARRAGLLSRRGSSVSVSVEESSAPLTLTSSPRRAEVRAGAADDRDPDGAVEVEHALGVDLAAVVEHEDAVPGDLDRLERLALHHGALHPQRAQARAALLVEQPVEKSSWSPTEKRYLDESGFFVGDFGERCRAA